MASRTLVGLWAMIAMLFGLIASVSVYAEDLGPSIEVPKDAKVQLQYDGYFTIKVADRFGLSGTFGCTCATGGGTCEVNSIVDASGQRFVCLKGKTGTCASVCTMTTASPAQ